MASREEVAGVFPTMVQRFDPKKAEGLNAVIQFDLSGENGGSWWVRVADGRCAVGTGSVASHNLTLVADASE